MTATYRPLDLRLVLLAALLLVAAAAVAAVQVAAPAPPARPAPAEQAPPRRYSDLPMTKHAAEAHAGQKWNAFTISAYWDDGGCRPKIDICPGQDFEIHYCELEPGKSIGMAIGKTVEKIITAYMARTSQWAGRC